MGPQVLQEAEKAKKIAERKDHYAILGIAQDVSPREVKQVGCCSTLGYSPE